MTWICLTGRIESKGGTFITFFVTSEASGKDWIRSLLYKLLITERAVRIEDLGGVKPFADASLLPRHLQGFGPTV